MIPLIVRRELDLAQLRLDIRILFLTSLQIGQNLLCFVESSLHDQPARTLWKPRDSRVQDDDEDELQRQRDAPRDSAGQVGETEGDPVGERESGDVHDEFDDDEFASPRCLRGLRLVGRRGSSINSVADSSHNPTHDHVRHAVRRALQQSADTHDCRADEDCVLAAHVVAEDERGDCTEETTNVVDRGYCALHAYVVTDAESVEEVASYNDTSEDTLVVTELWSFSLANGDFFSQGRRHQHTRVISVAQATVTQKVNHPPLKPKYRSPFIVLLSLLSFRFSS